MGPTGQAFGLGGAEKALVAGQGATDRDIRIKAAGDIAGRNVEAGTGRG